MPCVNPLASVAVTEGLVRNTTGSVNLSKGPYLGVNAHLCSNREAFYKSLDANIDKVCHIKNSALQEDSQVCKIQKAA